MNEQEREQYELHSNLSSFKRREDAALQLISESLEKGKGAVSWSVGKDSSVLLHLALRVKPDIDVIFSDRSTEGGGELPETYDVIEKWKELFNINLHVYRPRMTLFEILESVKNPFNNEKIVLKKIKKNITIEPIERAQDELGIDVSFVGLRAEENKNTRGQLIKSKGLFFQKTNGKWLCNPIGYWTTRDIWAYIVKHDLPYHPMYDRHTFQTREEIRLSNWAGIVSISEGRYAPIRYYYPELWEMFTERFPEVQQFV